MPSLAHMHHNFSFYQHKCGKPIKIIILLSLFGFISIYLHKESEDYEEISVFMWAGLWAIGSYRARCGFFGVAGCAYFLFFCLKPIETPAFFHLKKILYKTRIEKWASSISSIVLPLREDHTFLPTKLPDCIIQLFNKATCLLEKKMMHFGVAARL